MDHRFPTRDGVARAMPAGGGLVLCLHSSGSSAGQWATLLPALAAAGVPAVAAPDFHGHGAAAPWTGPPAEVLEADAALVLDRIDSTPGVVHLVGHSYGGAVALQAALRRPRRVASLALYEPVAFGLLLAADQDPAHAREAVATGRSIAAMVDAGRLAEAACRFVAYWSGMQGWDALGAGQRARLAARMPAVTAHFHALFARPMRTTDLATLDCPVLLLGDGSMHAPVRRIMHLLGQALPGARTVLLDGCGHMGPVTDPQRVNPLLAGFVAGSAAGRAGGVEPASLALAA